jgi:excisionase family DNA binding protein
MPELGLYTVAEVAEILRLPRWSTYQLIKEGKLAHCRLTERRIRVSEEDLNDFVRGTRRVGGPSAGQKLEIPCDCP